MLRVPTFRQSASGPNSYLSESEPVLQDEISRKWIHSQGRATLDARLELLESHRRDVQARIRELEDKLAIIDAKIKRFRQAG